MREVGMATVSCIARFALRMRLSMSAIGSVSIACLLPTGLGHAGDCTLVGECTEADPAELVPAEHGPRPAAAVAARVGANAVLRLALLLHAERGLGHVSYASLLSVANGIPSARRSALPCSSVSAVVVIAMSRPRIAGTES